MAIDEHHCVSLARTLLCQLELIITCQINLNRTVKVGRFRECVPRGGLLLFSAYTNLGGLRSLDFFWAMPSESSWISIDIPRCSWLKYTVAITGVLHLLAERLAVRIKAEAIILVQYASWRSTSEVPCELHGIVQD